MGRHSRKGPAPKQAATGGVPGAASGAPEAGAAASGGGRRRRGSASAGPGAHAPAGDAPYPAARGGHPEHHEAGGGWGDPYAGAGYPGAGARARVAPGRTAPGAPRVPAPRREFLEAFDGPAAAPARPAGTAGLDGDYGSDDFDAFGGARSAPARHRVDAPAGHASSGGDGPDDGGRDGGDDELPARGGRGRAFTGVAAAAVTTVLAVVVAGQVADGGGESVGAQSAGQGRGALQERPDRSEGRPTPPREAVAEPAPAAPVPTYRQLMATQFPLDPKLKGPGTFEAVKGFDKAPGKGRKVRYRIDVEKGLGLDAGLFARAVQETLNDDRSWAHNGAMTFERISSGEPEFVITLASPGTTGVWCAKSDLDTTVENVSCDSASTERVMINAFRWARGADTFGPGAMTAYRQMLINHEVGHRLGHDHVNCRTPGALAPVMQQQTKSLDIGGISCRPNPWVHPGE
ncbi:DUF3152 domain-containing protein [Streptomyces sp. NPDC005805]|uniref:DUF3152 domain-containing protein n=1 Tax=Streptomyces sp. NPDC005805 TaxID=3157068 RepID=UPI00340D0EF6